LYAFTAHATVVAVVILDEQHRVRTSIFSIEQTRPISTTFSVAYLLIKFCNFFKRS